MIDRSMNVAANLDAVRLRIAAACARAGRDPGEVSLVAVTKGVPAARIPAELLHDVGENRVQELLDKQRVLAPHLRWHFIGTLQRNKAKRVVGRVALIHSVDHVALADTLARAAEAARVVQDVLVQVNTAGEASKHGVTPAEAPGVARSAAAAASLRVRGFMTIAPAGPPALARAAFAALRAVRDEVVGELPEATALSMGMTGDLEEAIEEGATIVRVGTAIFGPRAR